MPDSVEFLMGLARNVSNLRKPKTDNNYGRAACEIERLRAFVTKVHDAVEDIDPDVLPPNASAAMVEVQDALAEISHFDPPSEVPGND